MKRTEFNWFASDGQKVYAQTWQPEVGTNIEAVIILVHGLGEHSNRYHHFADFFVEKNFAVIAFDLRGHGQSEGKRGHVSDYSILLGLVDKALEEASKRFPGEKKFIYGHSMGGNIVINHALTHNPRVLGVLASAPFLRTAEPVSSSKLFQAKLMNSIWGSYAENNQLDLSQLSRDQNVIDAYVEDELVHPKISVRFFLGAQNAADYSMDHADRLDIPMLLMHGTADTITSPDATSEFASKAPDYARFKAWNGLYHEIHNEPEQIEVMAYALEWMEEELRASSSIN